MTSYVAVNGKAKVTHMKQQALKLVASALAALAIATVSEGTAQAQEIPISGPLAGAPAVRQLRLYRKGRLEVAPSVSFTLLDEYQRTILVGGRLTYNITDWLGIGGWGGFGALKLQTGLADEIQGVNARRRAGQDQFNASLTRRNMGTDFADQLGSIDWVAAPQVTLVPFRGKIGLFESVYIDTDLYLFGGVGFVGLTERATCETSRVNGSGCTEVPFQTETRMAIAPTFGLGLSFYLASWGSLAAEWRGLPFKRNIGGFDNRGGGPDDDFPDLNVDDADREFRFNQMITLSFGISLPFDNDVSE